MGGSSSVPAGYEHYLDVHATIGMGEPDALVEIQFDGKRAWAGNNVSGEITINAPDLFNGSLPEGGVSGNVELLKGEVSQPVNTFLQGLYAKTAIPAFRGITSLIFKNFKWGNSPYFKNFAARLQYVYKLADGSDQWYPERAGIVANFGAEVEGSNLKLLGSINSYVGDQFIGSTFDGNELIIYEELSAGDINNVAFHTYRKRYYYLNDATPTFDQTWTVESINSVLGRSATQQHNANFIQNNTRYSIAEAAGNPGFRTWIIEGSYNSDPPVNRPLGPEEAYSGGSSGETGGAATSFGRSNYYDSTSGRIWALEAANWEEPDTSLVIYNYIGVWEPLGTRPVAFLREDEDSDLSTSFPSNIVCDQYGYAWGKNSSGFLFEFVCSGGIQINRKYNISSHFANAGDRWGGYFAVARDHAGSDSGGRLVVIDTNLLTIYDILSGEILEEFAHDPFATTMDVFDGGRYIRIQDKMYEFGYDVGSLPVVRNCNAVHIIRECLTDSDLFGKGVPANLLDDSQWHAAADTCYTEKMGCTLSWQAGKDVDEFILDVCRHINALPPVLNRRTGLIELPLIRNDYNINDVLVLDRTNVLRVEEYEKSGQSKRINTLIAKYTDGLTGSEASFTIRNSALIQADGGVIAETVQYPGFNDESVVWLAAHRDFRAMSSNLRGCTIYANRVAANLKPGDVVRLNWPELGFSGEVLRVFEARLGSPSKQEVRLVCTEDVFDVDSVPAIPQTERFTPVLVSDPAVIDNRLVFELPYYLLVQQEGEAGADSILANNPDAGFLAAAGTNPDKLLNAQLNVDNGTGYQNVATMDFCPWGDLSAAVGYTDTAFVFSSSYRLDSVAVGDYAQIGDELIVVNAIDAAAGTITAGRVALDSPVQKHSAGDRVYFYKDLIASDQVEYTASASIGVKLAGGNGREVINIDDVPADNILMNSRAIRPYLPGNIRANSVFLPDYFKGVLTLDWSHRDRLQQTSGTIFDLTAGDIGPEPGTTYNLDIYGDGDALLKSETGLTGTNYIFDDEGGDSAIANNVALLQMTGNDGDTSFPDETGRLWSRQGTDISVTDSVLINGQNSVRFPGVNGNAITAQDSDDFNFGAGDFVIEGFAIADPGFDSTWRTLLSQRTNASVNHSFTMNLTSGTGALTCILTSDGSNVGDARFISAGTPVAGQQFHWRVTVLGNMCRVFLDGVGGAVVDLTGFTVFNSSSEVMIGAIDEGSYTLPFLGYMGPIRIKKGFGFSLDDFTPPSIFPGIAGLNNSLRVELSSTRDGYESYHKHNFTIDRAGFGRHFGKYMGR